MAPIEIPQQEEQMTTLETVAANFSKARRENAPYAARTDIEHPVYGRFEVAVRHVAKELLVSFKATGGSRAHMSKAGFLSRVMNPVTDALGLHRAGAVNVPGKRTIMVTDVPAFYEIEVTQQDADE